MAKQNDPEVLAMQQESLKHSMEGLKSLSNSRDGKVDLAKDFREVVEDNPLLPSDPMAPPVYRKLNEQERLEIENPVLAQEIAESKALDDDDTHLSPFKREQLRAARAAELAEQETQEADVIAEEEMNQETPASETEEQKKTRLLQEQRLQALYGKYGKDEVHKMAQFEEILPEGYSLEAALQDKRMYGNIYLQSLPSGFYVFRALTRMDLESIRKIKGMNEQKVPNEVVQMCVLSPRITKVFIQTSSAGTMKTLCDIIYMYSDFMGQTTEAPLKL